MANENNTALHIIALGMVAAKKLQQAGIEEKYAQQIADVQEWSGAHTEALEAFATNWQNAKNTRNTEISALLSSAIEDVNAAKELIIRSDDGILNDFYSMEQELKNNKDDFDVEILAAKGRLEAERNEVDGRIGPESDWNVTFAEAHETVSLQGGSVSSGGGQEPSNRFLLIQLENDYRMGDLQTSLNPDYVGGENSSWGWLPVPEDATNVAEAMEHYGILNNKFILEENFDEYKGYIQDAFEGNWTSESFQFGPHEEMGLEAPQEPQDLVQWYWTHKKDQKYYRASVHSISTVTETVFGNVTPETQLLLKGTGTPGNNYNIHNGDLASIPNVFHHVEIDTEYISPSLMKNHEGVREIFLSPTNTSIDFNESITIGTSLFRLWMEQNNHIHPHTLEAYNNVTMTPTKYGTGLVDVTDDTDYYNQTWEIENRFGWDMTEFKSNNSELYDIFTHLLKQSSTMLSDYTHEAMGTIDQGDGYMTIRYGMNTYNLELDKFIDLVEKSINPGQGGQVEYLENKMQEALEEHVGSNGEEEVNEDEWMYSAFQKLDFNVCKDSIMSMLEAYILSSRVNYFHSNHKSTKLLKWDSAFDRIELSSNSKGQVAFYFHGDEWNKAIEGEYIMTNPVIPEIMGANGPSNFSDFAEEDCVYLEIRNGEVFTNGAAHSEFIGDESNPEEYYVIHFNTLYWPLNMTYYTPRYLKSSKGSTIQGDTVRVGGVIHYDKSHPDYSATMSSIEELKSWIYGSGATNVNWTNGGGAYYQEWDAEKWNEFISEFSNAGLKLGVTWMEHIENENGEPDGAFPYFAGQSKWNYQNVYGGSGVRVVGGEEITTSNALNYVGPRFMSYAMQLYHIWGYGQSSSPWGMDFTHLATDFVPEYQITPFPTSIWMSDIEWLGNYSNWGWSQFNTYTGEIVKNLSYDETVSGKILPTVDPTNQYYVVNAPFTEGAYKLDSEGNYTQIDTYDEDYFTTPWYRTNIPSANLSQIPSSVSEWLDVKNNNQYISVEKIARGDGGKIFKHFSNIPSNWERKDGEFKIQPYPNGIHNNQSWGVAILSNSFLYNFINSITGLYKSGYNGTLDINERRTAQQITITFPDWNGIEGFTYVKPKGYAFGPNTRTDGQNGNYNWSEGELAIYEYLHKAVRKIFVYSDGEVKHKIPEIPVHVWKAKVLAGTHTWAQYVWESLVDPETMPGWGASGMNIDWANDEAKQLMLKHGAYNESSSFIFTNEFYYFKYALPLGLSCHYDLELEPNGDTKINIIEPFLLGMHKEDGQNVLLQSKKAFSIKQMTETITNSSYSDKWGMNVSYLSDTDWDFELHAGIGYDTSKINPDLLDSFANCSKSEYVVEEPGGDGLYINNYPSLSNPAFPATNNRRMVGDVDSDGDGISDVVDSFPLDGKEIFNADGDLEGNNSDDFPFSVNAIYSILEDRDGNEYYTFGNLEQRGFAPNGIMIVDLPDHLNLTELATELDTDVFEGRVAVNDNDVDGQLIMQYKSNSNSIPASGSFVNLNKLIDLKNFASLDGVENILFNKFHFQASNSPAHGASWSDEDLNVYQSYNYTVKSIHSDYVEAFTNNTADFDTADDYLETIANLQSGYVRIRFMDVYGDSTLNNNSVVEIKQGDTVIHSFDVTGNLFSGNPPEWDTANSTYTQPDGITVNYWLQDNKEVYVSDIFELEEGEYTLSFTSDSWGNNEGNVVVVSVDGGNENGTETFLSGLGLHTANSQTRWVSNAVNTVNFTVTA